MRPIRPRPSNPAEPPGADVGLLAKPGSLTLVYLPGLLQVAQQVGPQKQARGRLVRSLGEDPFGAILGYMYMEPAKGGEGWDACGPVYVVMSSWAQPGWGPLLYDSAILTASFYGYRGLVPDRKSVSQDAANLWLFYAQQRPDVLSEPLPPGCPFHDVPWLDRSYAPAEGFPTAPLARLRRNMGGALQAASRMTGIPPDAIAYELGEAAVEADAVFAPPVSRVVRARAGNPPVILEGPVPNKRKERKKRKKTKSFWDKPRDWDEVLIELTDREITRRQIRDYYWENRDAIFPALKDQTVMVLFAPKKDFYLYRRNKPKGGPIKITKLEGIEDPESYEYWVNRRVIEFHTVIGAKTELVWVDIDPHPRDHDPAIYAAMDAAVPRVVDVVRTVFPGADVRVWWSGKRGVHVEGYLDAPASTDKARKDLRRHLDQAFEGQPTFTTGIARPGQIRLDVTTLKRTGSIRSPYSYTVTGGIKRPWEGKVPKPTLLARFRAKLKDVLGKTANPSPHLEKAMENELDRRVCRFEEILRKCMGKERYRVWAETIPGSKKVAPFFAVTVDVQSPRGHRCEKAECGSGRGPVDRCEEVIQKAFKEAKLDEFLEFDGTSIGPFCEEPEDCPPLERTYHYYERKENAPPVRLKRRLL